MSNILTIGLMTEGPTDIRFLQSVLERCFTEAVLSCPSTIEVFPVMVLEAGGNSFPEKVLHAAEKAEKQGINVLCVHADADDADDRTAFRHRIAPAFREVEEGDGELCRNLVAIVPIQMTEAWMLADVELLRDELGRKKSARELGINLEPSSYSDPKQAIVEAIRIALQDFPRRRRRQLKIGELYLPLGQKCRLEKLRLLTSFQKFEKAVFEALRKLNYLH